MTLSLRSGPRLRFVVLWPVVGLLISACAPSDEPEPTATPAVDAADPTETLGPSSVEEGPEPIQVRGEWRAVAQASLEARRAHAVVWTGEEVLVLGGYNDDGALEDGAAYDPVENTWRKIADAPAPVSAHAKAWTGSELIIWGGFGRDVDVAFDPEADEWRTLPPAPIADRMDHSMIWTGEEVIVWGGETGDYQRLDDGAAYNPATGQWRVLEEAPIEPRRGHVAVWTGEEMIVWGGRTSRPREHPTTVHDAGAYNPATGQWRTLPRGGFTRQSWPHTAVWTGENMVVSCDGCSPRLATYDPHDGWSGLDTEPPLEPRENHRLVWTGEQLMVLGGETDDGEPACDGAIRLHQTTGAWERIPAAPGCLGPNPPLVWTDTLVFTWGDQPNAQGAVYEP